MYVTTDAAALHLEMIEAFGLPVPENPVIAEVFGGYHVGNGPRFWHYDPHKQLWDVKSERTLHSRVAPRAEWSEVETKEIASTLAQLDMMGSPPFPEDVEIEHWEPAFIYQSCIFAWVFFPDLRRWSLAPLGKLEKEPEAPTGARAS